MLTELTHFFRQHLWHLLLLPVLGLTVYTTLHEAAHGLAVYLQGGQIVSFRWWPTFDSLGMLEYTFPITAEYSIFYIALAPYIFWCCLMLLAFCVSFFHLPKYFLIHSSIFIWLFFLPLADIALAALPYAIFQQQNDFYDALGKPSYFIQLTIYAFSIAAVGLTWFVHKNLYRENALSKKSFTFLSVIGLVSVAFF